MRSQRSVDVAVEQTTGLNGQSLTTDHRQLEHDGTTLSDLDHLLHHSPMKVFSRCSHDQTTHSLQRKKAPFWFSNSGLVPLNWGPGFPEIINSHPRMTGEAIQPIHSFILPVRTLRLEMIPSLGYPE